MELGQPIFQKTDGNEGIHNFMRGFALVAETNSRKAQLEARLQQMALQNQALEQRTELAREKFGLYAQRINNQNEYQTSELELQKQKLGIMGEHQGQVQDIASRTLDARNAELKLREEKARASLEDQVAKLHAQRVGLFNKTMQQFGLPYDAFENEQNWKKREDGKLFVEVPVKDNAGAQLYSQKEKVKVQENGKTVEKPKPLTNFVTLDKGTHDWLSSTYREVKADAVTPRMIPQDDPPPEKKHLGTYNPATGNFE